MEEHDENAPVTEKEVEIIKNEVKRLKDLSKKISNIIAIIVVICIIVFVFAYVNHFYKLYFLIFLIGGFTLIVGYGKILHLSFKKDKLVITIARHLDKFIKNSKRNNK